MEHALLSRRDALRAKRRRPSTITIPNNVSPHVRLVFEEMKRQGITYDRVEELSGVLRTTLKAWRHKNKPGLESIEAVLGSLGWGFVPIPRSRALPPTLVADLAPVAERHGLSMQGAIEALIVIFAGPSHSRPAAETPSTAPTLADLTA